MPQPGQVGTLTLANGRLTNSFISQCASYFEPFYFAKIVNDYSGSFLNPHFGSYGAVIFFGGGHAATNDNTVAGLVLGLHSCSFRRLVDPTPLFGADSSAQTRSANSLTSGTAFINMLRAEYRLDGQPVAPHSYSSGDVIGPDEGGAAHGSFIRVLSTAGAFIGTAAAESAHQVDFATTEGSYQWRRVNDNVGYNNGSPEGQALRIAPANWTAWVPGQNRIYTESRATAWPRSIRWFERHSGTWQNGTGGLRLNDAEHGSVTGAMFHVPERNLLIFADCKSGVLRLQYLDTTLSQPSWVSGVRLSPPVPLQPLFSTACWCPDNERILVGELAGDNQAIVEVSIPAALGDTWAATRVPFGAGQSIPWASNSSYKKWTYNPRVKAVVYMPRADPYGSSDTVYVYRPRNT